MTPGTRVWVYTITTEDDDDFRNFGLFQHVQRGTIVEWDESMDIEQKDLTIVLDDDEVGPRAMAKDPRGPDLYVEDEYGGFHAECVIVAAR